MSENQVLEEQRPEDKEAERPFWQTKTFWVVIVCLIGAFIVVATIYRPEWTGFQERIEISRTVERDPDGAIVRRTVTRKVQPGKTVWDWLSLLLGPPLLVTILGIFINQWQQQRAEQQAQLESTIARENQREEALQAYFDRLSTLLVDKNFFAIAAKTKQAGIQKDIDWDEQELLNAVVNIIQARTLSILRLLEKDGVRKGSVVQFLVGADIIGKLKLKLNGADLSNAALFHADLSGIDLWGINLNNANLSGADLSGAKIYFADLCDTILNTTNLSNAKLFHSNLSGIDLRNAFAHCAYFHAIDLSNAVLYDATVTHATFHNVNLSRADFSRANLINSTFKDAILLGADLERSEGLTRKQLTGTDAPLLCATKLPSDLSDLSDRDCDRLPHVLVERYSDEFETVEAAKEYVDKIRQLNQSSEKTQ